MKTKRSRECDLLCRLAAARATSLGEALYQIGLVAHYWPTLKTYERKKVEAAASPLAGLIERTRSRATGFYCSIFDSEAQGTEEPELDERGRNLTKYTVICDEHASCVCVPSIRDARVVAANPDFCDECRETVHSYHERKKNFPVSKG